MGEEGTEVARIEVTLTVTDGDVVSSVTSSEGLSVIEGAGMLTMALDTWLRTNGLRDTENG